MIRLAPGHEVSNSSKFALSTCTLPPMSLVTNDGLSATALASSGVEAKPGSLKLEVKTVTVVVVFKKIVPKGVIAATSLLVGLSVTVVVVFSVMVPKGVLSAISLLVDAAVVTIWTEDTALLEETTVLLVTGTTTSVVVELGVVVPTFGVVSILCETEPPIVVVTIRVSVTVKVAGQVF